ncbi:MAG TPA: hypothetical protein VMU70_01850 [Candidatus Tyrphobacter sp.]|nr:hypothetical protein [Candidatus Tyrphobacter sp.]
MSKKLVNLSKRKLPYPHKEEAEFLKPPRGMLGCESCSAVFYKKSWHHKPAAMKKRSGLTICPACALIKNRQYEGRIIIENTPLKLKPELVGLIKSFARKAYERDSQDRLIAIKEIGKEIQVTTTENQLAVRLGKKIRETFKKPSLEIRQPSAPSDVVYVKLTF